MRKLTEGEIDRLNSFLAGLDASMMASALDGFLSGVVVCPDLILPGEWLPIIWGEGGPLFDSADDANEIIGLIMARYNEISRGLLRKGKHEPILDLDTDGAVLWETWAEGLAAAIALRPQSWAVFDASDDEDVRHSFQCLASFAIRGAKGQKFDDDIDEHVRRKAPSLIADCLHSLNAARLKSHRSPAQQAAAHVGRNDPCPCGSGKKFKKCCLN